MHSLLSVFNPLHSNINIYAYSPYFSLCSDKENFLNNQELFNVSDHFLYSYDNNDNLGIILEGEISCMSLFWVWGLEKVNVQMTENLVCLAFLFTLQQDVSKIGILIHKRFIMCLIFMMYVFLLQAKKIKV